MTSTEEIILKADKRGRVRMPPERREALLAEFDRSGMSGAKFAAWAGIKYPTFANWVQERRRKSTGSEARSGSEPSVPEGVRWIEATLKGEPMVGTTLESRGLVIHLPGGARLEVATPSQAALACELLRCLGKRC